MKEPNGAQVLIAEAVLLALTCWVILDRNKWYHLKSWDPTVCVSERTEMAEKTSSVIQLCM